LVKARRDLSAPNSGSTRLTALTDEKISRSEYELGFFFFRKVHLQDAREVEAVP
jgi:hypothetical protein